MYIKSNVHWAYSHKFVKETMGIKSNNKESCKTNTHLFTHKKNNKHAADSGEAKIICRENINLNLKEQLFIYKNLEGVINSIYEQG